MVVDGGLWLSHPCHVPKEEVKAFSRVVEKKVRQLGSLVLVCHLADCNALLACVTPLFVLPISHKLLSLNVLICYGYVI
jgi:hypothetical protein